MPQEWRKKMKIRVKKLDEHAVLPTRGSVDAAGYDLYVKTTEDTVIPPHETVMIGTGLAMEIPQGYFGAILRGAVSHARAGCARQIVSAWWIPITAANLSSLCTMIPIQSV